MGGFYQDLRKHEGAVPARVNEVLALLYGGEHLATGHGQLQPGHGYYYREAGPNRCKECGEVEKIIHGCM